MGERATFDQLKTGEKFKTVGKITGALSLYTYEKIEPIAGQDGVTYNGKAMIGLKGNLEHYGAFTDEYVEKV